MTWLSAWVDAKVTHFRRTSVSLCGRRNGFWRRWHISLPPGSRIGYTNYLLGGNQVSNGKAPAEYAHCMWFLTGCGTAQPGTLNPVGAVLRRSACSGKIYMGQNWKAARSNEHGYVMLIVATGFVIFFVLTISGALGDICAPWRHVPEIPWWGEEFLPGI